MLSFSINLPKRLKLSLKLEKKLGRPEKTLFPEMGEFLRVKENKIVFFFKHLFENKKIKKLIGVNLAFMVIASNFLPTSASTEIAEVNIVGSPIVLNTDPGVQFPVKNIKVTQGYRFYHPGTDFDGITGDSIYPIMDGVVTKVEYSRFGYGKSILVSHGDEIVSLYAHLSKIEVAEGQDVSKETKLGEMGASGRAFGDHSHLEVYEEGKAINPLSVIN
jgi:murein DD-endopeptidase MepM/ murein hydrolase activator NlpD